MIYLAYAIHSLICIFLILVVLLQSGKGADLSVFGGGSTQTFFGARGATTLLHKLTVGSFVAFIITTGAIAILQGHQEKASVMTGAEQTQPAADETAPATGEQPAEQPPGQPAEQPAEAAPTGDTTGGDQAPAGDAATTPAESPDGAAASSENGGEQAP